MVQLALRFRALSHDTRFCFEQVGAWRDRIVICTGKYGPNIPLVKAFLDGGAKAVIAPTLEPFETRRSTGEGLNGDGEGVDSDDGRFVIEDEEEEPEPASPDGSDWEDNDDRIENRFENQEREEKDIASFVGVLYDALFGEGSGAETALQHALETHPKQHYRCHLPNLS
jgi:hypothetical protein